MQGSGNVQVSVDPEGDGVVATLNDIQFPAGGEVVVTERTITAMLTVAIDADDDMITVDNADSFPSFGIVVIEGEEISYSGINDNTLIVAARGENAAPHAANTPVTVPTRVPECSATPDVTTLNKEVVFSFLPDGCTPGTDCQGVRAIVIALDNLDEITNPTPVYTCRVQTNQDEGTFTLGCPEVGVACTSDEQCEEAETCNTTSGICVPDAPFQPAQAGDSPLVKGQVGNLPTTCTEGEIVVGVSACVGDCNSNVAVTIGEVQRCIGMLLETLPADNCVPCDRNGNGSVTIGEVQEAISNLLTECPQ
jgi:hypothetical protein